MPSDFMLKTMNTIHRALFKATNGMVGGSLLGMPVVDLKTIGRKSGQPRTSMLTSPVQEGDKIVLVASRGGDPQHPGWYHNIPANPDVEVCYEDDLLDPARHQATADRVMTALDMPSAPVRTPLRRGSLDDLRAQLSNWDEVADVIGRTRFADFLTD